MDLIFEKSKPGRKGISLPKLDVPKKEILRPTPGSPDTKAKYKIIPVIEITIKQITNKTSIQ